MGLHDVDLIKQVGAHFKLHPLTTEDVLNTGQRPKMEIHDDYVFIVAKMIMLNPETREVIHEQVSVVLGHNWVLTFQERPGDVFEGIRNRIRNNNGRIRKAGADYLTYALLDSIVDYYFTVLEDFGDRTEVVEESLLNNEEKDTVVTLQAMKRKIIGLRRSIWPLREVINNLSKSEEGFIKKDTIIYLRDLYDHTIQIIDTVESYRDILGGIQDLYLSVVNNKMNEVMKVLALISTVFMPMGLIAGIYGMNFESMPEKDLAWGYPAALGLMAFIGLGMFWFFKTRKWL